MSIDPHKLTRGKILDLWIEAHGGASRCLSAAGYLPGTPSYRSREAHVSDVRKNGMGHKAALRYEQEFEPLGMAPGTLTNNLDAADLSRRAGEDGAISGSAPEKGALIGSGNSRKSLEFSASLPISAETSVTHYRKSPRLVSDWAEFGSGSLDKSSYPEGGFDALVAPGQFPSTFELTKVSGDWMEPEIQLGDWIWVDRFVTPDTEDVVIAESTETGERFMGRYRRGYRKGEYVIAPNKGEKADSSVHPIRVLAVMMARLELRQARRA